MTTDQAPDYLTRREYLALVRHVQRDIENGADGTFHKWHDTAEAYVFDEREAEIVQKALAKVRAHLLTVERRS